MSLRSVLLVLLSKEPNTGYGVGRLLHRELRHLWDARLQQIYGEFGRLEEEGLVVAESIALPNRPAKKVYSLTDAGWHALDCWLGKTPAVHPAKDELLVQLYCLERTPEGVIARRLEQRRDESLTEAAALRELILSTPRTDPARLGALLALEASLTRAEAEVAWCVRALVVLRDDPSRAATPDEQLASAHAASG